MKKYLPLIISTVVLAAGNILIWTKTSQTNLQIAPVSFALVWVDLVFSWVVAKSQRPISYLFVATAVLIELLTVTYIFWVLRGTI